MPSLKVCKGEDGNCECEGLRVPAQVKVSNVLDRTPQAKIWSSPGGVDEEMDTQAQVDLEDLPPGALPLATRFHKSANAVSMLVC